jgi:hypothetical protein
VAQQLPVAAAQAQSQWLAVLQVQQPPGEVPAAAPAVVDANHAPIRMMKHDLGLLSAVASWCHQGCHQGADRVALCR